MSNHTKTDNDWKKLLSDESFRVTRQSGTERPFTGKYWNFNEDGIYKCICCGESLFESDTKFGDFILENLMHCGLNASD